MSDQPTTPQADELEHGVNKADLDASWRALRLQQERAQWQQRIEQAERELRVWGVAHAYRSMVRHGVENYPEHLRAAVAGIVASLNKPRPDPMLVEAVNSALSRVPDVSLGEAAALLAQQRAVIEATPYNWRDERYMLENAEHTYSVRQQAPPEPFAGFISAPNYHVTIDAVTGEVRTRKQ